MQTVNIVSHYIGGTGGVQVYNETLARVLVNLGYKVNLIGLAKQDCKAEVMFNSMDGSNIRFICLNQDDIFFKKPHIFLKKLISKNIVDELLNYIGENDIIIVSNPICMPFIAQIPDWKNYNIIGQFHGSVTLAMEGKGMYHIYRYLINRYYRDVKKFLVLTSEDAKVLAQKYHFKNVNFLLNPSRFHYESIQSNVTQSKKILFLGRLDKIKQIDHIILAYRLSNLFQEGYELDIYGDGPEENKLKKFIKIHNICGVNFKGRTSNVKDVMSKSAIIVMASKSEGLPLNLLEAVSIGLPIVTYNTSAGIREIVQDGYNGYLIDMNDIDALASRMAEVVMNKELLNRLAENSYKSSEKYGIESFSRELKKIL